MKTRYNTLLVLVPHRDTRLVLQQWSAALFAAGYAGAWSFPWVAPLAVLSRPLNGRELKRCAAALRAQSLENGGGKIRTAALGANCVTGSADFSAAVFDGEKAAILGPLLELAVPESAFSANGVSGENAAEKIVYRFPKLLAGACLLREENPLCGGGVEGTGKNDAALPPLPAFFFRAAALANMRYYPLPQTAQAEGGIERNNYSFGWRIGKLHWLPPVKKERRA